MPRRRVSEVHDTLHRPISRPSRNGLEIHARDPVVLAVDLFVATRNAHKTAEFAQILGPDFSVADLSAWPNLPEVEETGSTFEENAMLKALAAAEVVPGLIVADDSGLEVDVLAGAPGVYSARYAGLDATDNENITQLLTELAAVGEGRRSARFRCALALAREREIVATFQAAVEGQITISPAGTNGFGYDPVFVPDGYSTTFAQLGPAVKNRLSHRAKAITQLRAYLLRTGPAPG